MKRKPIIWPAALAMLAIVTAACGQGGGSGSPVDEKPSVKEEAPPQPVTLKLYAGWKITDEDYEQIFFKPLRAKYPHIKVETITASGDINIRNMVAAGDVPDLLITGVEGMQSLLDLGVALDLREQIKLQNFDLNRLDPSILQTVKSFGKNGEIVALPYGMNYNALYYNKTLFDRFGVAYPKDGMTWDEVIELGRKVSRTDAGVQYRGLASSNIVRVASPFSLNRFDPATGKASINTEAWKRAFQTYQAILSIPGNTTDKKNSDELNAFLYEKTIAMYPFIGLFHRMAEAAKGGLDWDLATYPQYPDKKGLYGEADGYFLLISPTSKHQKEAFQLIGAVLDESAQLDSAKKGASVPPLNKKEITDQFGIESEVLKGKNVQAIFKHRPVPYHNNPTKYDAIADSALNAAGVQLFTNAKDINTLIRETEESINAKVAAEAGK